MLKFTVIRMPKLGFGFGYGMPTFEETKEVHEFKEVQEQVKEIIKQYHKEQITRDWEDCGEYDTIETKEAIYIVKWICDII